jgi:hypothetical protein
MSADPFREGLFQENFPQPPYKPEEVPIWYPDGLRTHLTTISRETFLLGEMPYEVYVPPDPTESLEDTIARVIGVLNQFIAEKGGASAYYSNNDENYETVHSRAVESIKCAFQLIIVGEDSHGGTYVCDVNTGEVRHGSMPMIDLRDV